MKRTISLKIVIVLLLLTITANTSAMSASSTSNLIGADSIYFTAVGNRLLPLTHSELPVIHNGVMYVPYSVFGNSILRTSAFHSKSANTVRILQGTDELIFYLNAQRTEDHLNREFPHSLAIMRNETPYVPARFVAGFFGLNYSLITESGINVAGIVRISAANSVADDVFVNSALIRMSMYLDVYHGAAPDGYNPAPTVTGTPEPEPDKYHSIGGSELTVYLTIIGANNGHEILDILDGTPATFYLTADEIRDNAGFVRRAVGSGMSIAVPNREPDGNEGNEAAATTITASAYLREVAVIGPRTFYEAAPNPLTLAEALELLENPAGESSINIVVSSEEPETIAQLKKRI